MDKWLNNPTSIKIISLLLALFLFIQVGNSELSKTAREVQLGSIKEEAFIEDVPVQIYYDQESYVASGVPETCTVKISGPKGLVMQEEAEQNFTVAIYLEDPKLGENTVKLEVEGLSENLTAEVSPPTAVIDIQERVSDEYSVEYSIDKLELPEDYTIADVIISPNVVTVSGSETELEKISTVKVILNEEDVVDESYEKDLPIKAYDAEGNELNVTVEPETARVEVKIQSPSKEVGINPVVQGEVAPGFVLDDVTLSQQTVTAYGTNEALNDLSTVDVIVNVSGLKESKTISVKLEKPDGIENFSESKIDVTINVSPEVDKTFKGIQVEPINFDATKYEIEYLDGNTVDVIAQGSEKKLSGLEADNIEVTFDASNLSEGTYDVGLIVTGPPGFTYTPSKETIEIQITEK